MWKLNKTLIKKGFKSIFKTKLFSVLMMGIVLISGTAYTMLQSSSHSLSSSYNKVMTDGKLADSVIKQNFIASPSSTIEVKIKDLNGISVAISEQAVKDNGVVNGKITTLNLIVEGTDDYASLNGEMQRITFENTGNSDADNLAEVSKQADSYRSELVHITANGFANTYVEELNKIYSGKLIAKNTQSLSVAVNNSNSQKAFKVVNLGNDANQNLDVNIMNTYDGTSLITSPQTSAQMMNELTLKIQTSTQPDVSRYNINKLKDYIYTASLITGLGGILQVVDPSSYEAIVSPAFANANGKHSLSQNSIHSLTADPNFMQNLLTDQKLKDKYENNLIWVDNVPFFIVGIGTTPDFSYPIIDAAHPTIDIKNQAVVFVNNMGFSRVYDAFRGNQQENYTAIKFDPSLSSSEIEALKTELQTIGRGGTRGLPVNQWPNNIKILTNMNDRHDQVLLAQERVMFLSDLNKTIKTLSYVTTTLLVIFVLSIIVMVFNVLLAINRKTFATMLALGYSKTQLALSNALSALVLIGVPSVIGYLIGYGLQFWFVGIFDDYWTIPTYGESFSIVSLILIAVVPIVTVGILISLVTIIQLRRDIPNMLNESPDGGLSWLSRSASNAKYIGIMTKYALGLSARNLGKLMLLVVTSLIAMASLSIGFSTLGKADMAYKRTVAMSNYNFEVDLYSPTLEGGQYNRVFTKHASGVESIEDLMNGVQDSYDLNGNPVFSPDQLNVHIPGIGDKKYGIANEAAVAINMPEASRYLRNKIQTKVLLDMGSNMGINPWDIAERLMPENQRNIANADALLTNAIAPLGSLNQDKANALKQRIVNDDMPYFISYNQVITNSTDELYTYVDTVTTGNSSEGFKIRGIDPATKMINLPNGLLTSMENSSEVLPILINKYISKKMGLHAGDTIDLDILNMVDRNFVAPTSSNVTAKVIEVIDGYDSSGVYTVKSKADALLGMDALASPGHPAFNGVFSLEKDPSILSTLPLYSPSGFYIGADAIYGDWETTMVKMLADSSIWSHGTDITNDIDAFKQIYSTTPYVAVTSTVNWKEISKSTFKNVSKLSSSIIYIIEVISIVVSVIFTLIVAGLLLVSNRKKIATLWTLGYRKREIGRVFLSIYIIPILIAFAISIPIAYAVLAVMQHFVMNLGSVLIPFTLVWWIPLVALVVVSLIFVLATVITIRAQKQSKALDAFKGD